MEVPQTERETKSKAELLSDETFINLFSIEDEIQRTKERQKLVEMADKAKCKNF